MLLRTLKIEKRERPVSYKSDGMQYLIAIILPCFGIPIPTRNQNLSAMGSGLEIYHNGFDIAWAGARNSYLTVRCLMLEYGKRFNNYGSCYQTA